MGWLSFIPGLSSLIQMLGNLGIKLYDTKLQAEGSHEAKVVELAKREMELEQRESEVNASIKAQIRGRWYAPENLAFYFIAFPYWFKAVTIDNVLGAWIGIGFTNPLQGDTAKAMMMIMGFWFGKRAVESIGEAVKAAFGKK